MLLTFDQAYSGFSLHFVSPLKVGCHFLLLTPFHDCYDEDVSIDPNISYEFSVLFHHALWMIIGVGTGIKWSA